MARRGGLHCISEKRTPEWQDWVLRLVSETFKMAGKTCETPRDPLNCMTRNYFENIAERFLHFRHALVRPLDNFVGIPYLFDPIMTATSEAGSFTANTLSTQLRTPG